MLDRKEKKKVSWTLEPTMYRRMKIVACKGALHPLSGCEETTCDQARPRATKEKEKDIIKVSVCFLSLSSGRFNSMCQAKVVDSFFIYSFSLLNDYKEV